MFLPLVPFLYPDRSGQAGFARTASAMKVEIVKIDRIPVKILHIFLPFKFYNSKVYLKDPNGNFQTYHKKGGN